MSKPDPHAEKAFHAHSDPTLFGLGARSPSPPPSTDVDDADVSMAQDLLKTITTADTEPVAEPSEDIQSQGTELSFSDLDTEPDSPPSFESPRQEIVQPHPIRGNGLIYSANGEPFRDSDAAQFKARRLQDETGEPFEVISVSTGQFAIRPVRGASSVSGEHSSRSPSDFRSSSLMAYDEKDPKDLTLDDFPDEHPVRKHKRGLALYKKLSQKHFKLKQSYRSQISLLILAFVGALIAAFPVQTINLIFPPESLSDIAQQMSLQNLAKAFMYLGLAISAFALGKILWVRLYYRYLLMPNYAKSEQGIIAKKSTKMLYANIQATDLHITFFGRLFNFGTIELSCAGTDGSEILIENVYCPEIVQSIIEARKLEDQISQFRPR